MATIDEQLAEDLQKQINQLLDDEILRDLDTFPTEEEVGTLIAVEQGHAYQITLNRDPLPAVGKFAQQ